MKKLPKIGLRIIKSAIAIGLCFLVDYLRDGQGIVFYSQLSALWCMQVYRTNTKKNAVQRTIGTIIGALYGLVFLLGKRQFNAKATGFDLGISLAISVLIIAILYTTVLIKKKQASYFSCVVFLSIAVNHMGDANPYLFVFNRFLDTLIGIIIGICVNNFELPSKKDRETLFISTLDETLLNRKEKMSDYSKVELNRMIDDGLKFSVATMRTPGVIAETLRDVKLNYPVIAMDGAVLYDVSKKEYLKCYVISKEKSAELRHVMEEYQLKYFTNIVIDDTLLIYYQSDMKEHQLKLVEELKFSPYRNYINRPAPEDEAVLYYMILDTREALIPLYRHLQENGYTKDYKVVFYESYSYKGLWYLKIFNKNATMENMEAYLLEYTQVEKKITFGTIKDKYDVLVSGTNANEAVNDIKKLYRKKLRL